MLRIGIILTAMGFIMFVLGLLDRGRGSPRLPMSVGAVLFVAGVVLLVVALV
jgi:hypothetical protein